MIYIIIETDGDNEWYLDTIGAYKSRELAERTLANLRIQRSTFTYTLKALNIVG